MQHRVPLDAPGGLHLSLTNSKYSIRFTRCGSLFKGYMPLTSEIPQSPLPLCYPDNVSRHMEELAIPPGVISGQAEASGKRPACTGSTILLHLQ